jgi:hypothetical protein
MRSRNPFEPPQSQLFDDSSNESAAKRPTAVELGGWLVGGSGAVGILGYLMRGMKEPAFTTVLAVAFLMTLAFRLRCKDLQPGCYGTLLRSIGSSSGNIEAS